VSDTLRFAAVRWRDACWERTEQKPGEMVRTTELLSVGILLFNDEEGVTLASDHDTQAGTYRFQLSIPRCNVIAVEMLEVPR
jgi:hypothetical protein